MKCAWTQLLDILPVWLRQKTDKQGRDSLQEVRLRIGMGPEFVMGDNRLYFDHIVQQEDLNFVVNTASRYSPWASVSSSMGYITAQGNDLWFSFWEKRNFELGAF